MKNIIKMTLVLTLMLANVFIIAKVTRADYTYEKINNAIKITSTETTVETKEETNSIEAMEAQIATLEVSKANTLTYYTENIIRLDAEIAVIQAHIVEAKKLGVTKFVPIVE